LRSSKTDRLNVEIYFCPTSRVVSVDLYSLGVARIGEVDVSYRTFCGEYLNADDIVRACAQRYRLRGISYGEYAVCGRFVQTVTVVVAALAVAGTVFDTFFAGTSASCGSGSYGKETVAALSVFS